MRLMLLVCLLCISSLAWSESHTSNQVASPTEQFHAEYGTVQPLDVLLLHLTGSPWPIRIGSVVSGSLVGWVGSGGSFSAVVPESHRGSHRGSFTGDFVLPAGTKGGEGTPPIWNGDATARTACSVKVTTTGTVEIIQDSDGSTTSVTAEITPAGGTINWALSGPGKDFVTWTATQTGNSSTITIKLRRPVSMAWVNDSSVTATASSASDESCSDYKNIPLKKFKRNGLTAPGSSPVVVNADLESVGPPPSRPHWTISGNAVLTSNVIFASLGEKISSSEITSKSPVVTKTANFNAHYESTNDVAHGTYSIRESIAFSGNITASGSYEGFGHNAIVVVAGAVSGGFDNEPVALTDNSAGAGYEGSPTTLSVGVGYPLGGSISTDITIVSQDTLLDRATPVGTYILTSSGDHPAGQTKDVPKLVTISVGLSLSQQQDDEWDLYAGGSLAGVFPRTMKFEFTPDI